MGTLQEIMKRSIAESKTFFTDDNVSPGSSSADNVHANPLPAHELAMLHASRNSITGLQRMNHISQIVAMTNHHVLASSI